ncbi:MAG: AMP-binding protein [Actinomycetota bacterium]|nr:AMP-binding protein [Actinomycetota bacterium]MDQ2958135.1 AMP-binding protein [Actinomycetota bacterium]
MSNGIAGQVSALAGKAGTRAGIEGLAALSLLRAGAFGIEPPQRLARVLLAFRAYGPAGAALAVACQRHPHRSAIIDERGPVSFAELDERTDRLANALRARGFADGHGVGIMCRNHRGMFEALFAAAKLGARTVLLNTDFGGPQLAEVCDRERVSLLIHDEEFSALLGDYRPPLGTLLGWCEEPSPDSLDALIATGESGTPRRPARTQQIVLLTSGTTGTPKGAAREFGTSLAIPGGYLSKIELRSQRPVYLSVPVFHAWGLLSAMIALALADTLVLSRRAEPAEVLAALRRHHCDALITVPIVLSRLLTELESSPDQLPDLRVVAVSGSALPPELAACARRRLGEVLYNLYGSTEVAYASIATPADLAAAPGTVGKAPYGTVVKVLDADGREVERGSTGRIFVGSSIQFGGYTGGGSKEQIAGLMSTGDLGHLDADGRLFVDGRDDDMIVSGGENVFPGEVEELLAGHPGIAEAAVLGVPDPDFGQRLRAYVVRSESAELDAEQVRQYVKKHLARYKVPRDVEFREALPRNPAGKVIKRELG